MCMNECVCMVPCDGLEGVHHCWVSAVIHRSEGAQIELLGIWEIHLRQTKERPNLYRVQKPSGEYLIQR